MTFNHWVNFSLPCLLFLLALGCGDSKLAIVPIKGQVFIDGEPLADAFVTFIPTDSRPATGQTDAQGNFQLSTYLPNDGCVPGTHTVTVEKMTSRGDTEEIYHVPMKYQDPETSGLTATVDQDNPDIKLELTWDGKKGPIVKKVQAE